MKIVRIFCLIFCAHIFLHAQSTTPTNVDKLVATMDSLAMMSFDNWKVSPDLKNKTNISGDPTQPIGWET